MTNGLTSKYLDGGYSSPSASPFFYDQNGNFIDGNTYFTPEDIYISTQKIGVYLINGTYNTTSTSVYPVPCSLTDLNNFGAPYAADDAWLVYPGYGFTLYTNTSYGGTISFNYTNNDVEPRLFYLSGGGYNGRGTPIKQTSGADFPVNATRSIQIYFRFAEVTIPNLTS